MNDSTHRTADEWTTCVFPHDFRGRDGVRAILAHLLERGAECRMVDSGQTLSVSAPVGGKLIRVIAFMTSGGRKQFQITFVDFQPRVSQGNLNQAADLLSVSGTTEAINAARQSGFRTKRKSVVSEVLAYPEKVDRIIEVLDLISTAKRSE